MSFAAVESYNPNDYFVKCDQNHDHWGAEGAAGLMLHHQDENGTHRYLMQQRSPWVEHGLTWAPPAGALAPGETPIQGALREGQEEMGRFPSANHEVAHVNDHGGWQFHTVTADTPHMFDPDSDPNEVENAAWMTPEEIDELPLHPGFKESWNDLRPTPPQQRQAARAAAEWILSKTKTPGESPEALPEREETGDEKSSVARRKVALENELSSPDDESVDPGAQILDHLSMSSVAHNLHYKYEQAPLTMQEATEYAARLLDMMGYRNPDEITISTALNAWHQLYPQDKQLNQGPAVQPVFEAPPTVPSASWGYGTTSAVSAPPVPELYHWTDAANLHDWMDEAHTGPGSTYLTEHGEAPDDESWNPDVPMMQNPVRLTIDHNQLDPDGWDDTYHGWLNNYLYHGPIPKGAIKQVKAFPPAETWDMPEHWSKAAASWGQNTDSFPWTQMGIPRPPAVPSGPQTPPSAYGQQHLFTPPVAEQATAPPPPAPAATGIDMAAAHTGQIPGDERFMHDNIFDYEPNRNSGVNPSYTGVVADPNNEQDPGVSVYVKPAGQFHSDDLVHERAAFGLGRELGVPIPHTVVRQIPHPDPQYNDAPTNALIQEAVPGASNLMRSHEPYDVVDQWPGESRRIALFDNVIGNHDRHMGNVVQGGDGALYAIDHGGAFLNPGQYQPYGLAEEYGGQQLDSEEEEMLQRAHDHDLSQYGMKQHEIDGVRNRIGRMLDTGRFPGYNYGDDDEDEYEEPAPDSEQYREIGRQDHRFGDAAYLANHWMKDRGLEPHHINKIHDDALYWKGAEDSPWPQAYGAGLRDLVYRRPQGDAIMEANPHHDRESLIRDFEQHLHEGL